MENISELVVLAKGDRTYREYAYDSGVDSAVIAKIANGSYIPQKPDVYRKLTSNEAKPQNNVTYEKMISAVNESKAYKDGVRAGLTPLVAGIGSIGLGATGVGASLGMMGVPIVGPMLAGAVGATALGVTVAKRKKYEEEYKKKCARMKEYIAIVNGVFFGYLAKKGITFKQLADESDRLFVNEFDNYLNVENDHYSEYILRYVFFDEKIDNVIIETVAKKYYIEDLMFCRYNPRRKISLIVENKDVYRLLAEQKDMLSYKGNLSVILIDRSKFQLVDETVLSVVDSMTEEQIKFVKEEIDG